MKGTRPLPAGLCFYAGGDRLRRFGNKIGDTLLWPGARGRGRSREVPLHMGRIGRARERSKTDKLPSGGQWLHEIKHDGFRIIARKNGAQVRLYSRPGNDLTRRFPQIVDALSRLRSRSCIIDGEAVACDDNGVAVFQKLRQRRGDRYVVLCAFDLLELDGKASSARRR